MAPPIVDLDFHHPTPNGPGGTAVESAIGPYDLLSTLGRGGMGHVHRARHRESGAIVALKTVRAAEASHLASIRREIHSLARLRHPGIVRVVDEGLERGMPWYAMELCEGATLRDLVPGVEDFGTDVGPELVRVVTLIARLCASLAYLHGEGLVHRDLKPENVMVRSGDAPLLVDFGIASAFTGRSGRDVLWLDSDVVGTPAYMAPEQALGKAVDARGDLYALGCMLHELLTGAPPFSDGSAGEVLRMHLDVAPSPPSRLRGGIPPELDDLVLRLLAKEPAERLGHADDVAARLRALGASGDDTALPPARTYVYRPSLAGRRDEMAALRARLRSLRAGTGGILLLDAASGAGKTRLLSEIASEARAEDFGVLSGECLPLGGRPLEGLRQPLLAIADRCREAGRAESERVFGRRGKRLALYEPSLATLPGQEEHPEPAELPPDTALIALHEDLAGVLASLARDRPVVLVLDDLHWADDLVISFLEHAVRSRAMRSCLVLGGFRTEERTAHLGALLSNPGVATLALPPLRAADVGAMARGMLAMDEMPRDFAAYLEAQSEGNPFFVAESLRLMVAESILARDAAGQWRLPEGRALPASMKELVANRLRGLSQGARELARCASVLGRVAEGAVLQRMAAHPDAPFLDGIAELVARQAVEESARGYRFLHDKLREVAYDTIAPPDRAALHARAAGAIEAVHAGNIAPKLAELAHHHDRAGDRASARRYYLSAATGAVTQLAREEAERLYLRYLALVEDPDAESIRARGNFATRVLQAHGRQAEARDQHLRALSEARAIGDRRLEGLTLHELGDVHTELGCPGEAEEALSTAVSIGRQIADAHLEGIASGTLGVLLCQLGRLAEARAAHDRCLELAREDGDLQLERTALGNLAIVLNSSGRPDDARPLLEESRRIAREIGDRYGEAIAIGNIAWLQGTPARIARELAYEALPTMRELGIRPKVAWLLLLIGAQDRLLGDLPEARAHLEEALSLARGGEAPRSEAQAMGLLGAVFASQGRLPDAVERLERSAAIFERISEPPGEGMMRLRLGRVLQRLGRIAEARAQCERGQALCAAAGYRLGEGLGLGCLADQETLEGDPAVAEELAARGEAILETIGATPDLGVTLCARARAIHASGRSAAEVIARVKDLLRRIAAEQVAQELDLLEEVEARQQGRVGERVG